jgi:branched-chain amino acid transport system substrate-binding protein
MAEIARNPLHLANGAILFINTDYGRGYADAFEKRFRGLDGTIKVRAGFSQDQTDFRAQLAQIKNDSSIEFVYLASHVREAASILRQAADLGLQTRWLASNAVEAPELFTIAGGAAEGVILTVEAYDPASTASSTFNAAYKKAYGRDSEMFAAHAYDAVKLFAQELGKAKGDPNRLRDALYSIRDWPGASGPTTFDKNGDVIKAVSVKVAQGQRFKAVTNDELASLFTPSPSKQ